MGVFMKIDFVSDVSCPWCAVGLHALEQAIANLDGAVPIELHFQPFELNPQMPPEGEEMVGHLTRKYGITPEQVKHNTAAITERGAAVGFTFGTRERIYNSFDAHRLLHWAGVEGPQYQQALKHALLRSYLSDGENLGSHDVLTQAAVSVGLDGVRARAILASDEYAAEVRERERYYTEQGIHAVPSVIINDRHLIQGGQPVEAFEQALREIAAGAA